MFGGVKSFWRENTIAPAARQSTNQLHSLLVVPECFWRQSMLSDSPITTIQRELTEGSVIVLDGGTGTELERRGAAMHTGAWCAMATLTVPETLREIHEDYIRAGARVITANTFSANRLMLEPAGNRRSLYGDHQSGGGDRPGGERPRRCEPYRCGRGIHVAPDPASLRGRTIGIRARSRRPNW